MAETINSTSNRNVKPKRNIRTYTEEQIRKKGLPSQPDRPETQDKKINVKSKNTNQIKIDNIPVCKKYERVIPNTIARSSLFSPISRRCERKKYDLYHIASRGDVEIKYTGTQLDMSDADLFMYILEVSKDHKIGEPFKMSRYELLKGLNRNICSTGYEWLFKAMHRLKTGNVFITNGSIKAEFSLVNKYKENTNLGYYELTIDSEILKLFINSQYGLIDLNKRLELKKRINLSKWMQTYISTHKKGEIHKISLKFLKDWCGLDKSQVRKFRVAMKESINELTRLSIIEKSYIRDDDMVILKPI